MILSVILAGMILLIKEFNPPHVNVLKHFPITVLRAMYVKILAILVLDPIRTNV